MWIFDHAEDITERVKHSGDSYITADILYLAMLCRSEFKKVLQRSLCIFHSPVSHHASASGSSLRSIRVKPQLVTADVKADIERLIEIGLDAERLAVPTLGLL